MRQLAASASVETLKIHSATPSLSYILLLIMDSWTFTATGVRVLISIVQYIFFFSQNPLKKEHLPFFQHPLQPTALIFGRVGLHNVIVEPHVGHRHPILGQGAGLVGANGARRAERLHSLQVLHQTVFARHALRSQSQAHLTMGWKEKWKVFLSF